MKHTPVYFDADIPLHKIIEAIRPMGWTLKGDGTSIVVVKRAPDIRQPVSNVVPMRRRP